MSNRILSTLLLIFAAVVSAYGKGPVDLILISGGGLNQPIEITDPASLHTFDPWIGQFADWKAKPLVDAPCYRRSFEVMFYMKWPGRNSSFDRGDLKMIYATRYCWTGKLDMYICLGLTNRFMVATGAQSFAATRMASGIQRRLRGILCSAVRSP